MNLDGAPLQSIPVPFQSRMSSGYAVFGCSVVRLLGPSGCSVLRLFGESVFPVDPSTLGRTAYALDSGSSADPRGTEYIYLPYLLTSAAVRMLWSLQLNAPTKARECFGRKILTLREFVSAFVALYLPTGLGRVGSSSIYRLHKTISEYALGPSNRPPMLSGPQ